LERVLQIAFADFQAEANVIGVGLLLDVSHIDFLYGLVDVDEALA
jgi:hypothetical protein